MGERLDNHTIPVATYESWRSWLMTGSRRTRVDPRRMQGAHRGLKKILLEGLHYDAEAPYTWKDFSGAMVRHAVDDAMRALPPQDTKLVKLAYFGGYTNREIAREVGLTEWTVQRRISQALAAISHHIQYGRAMVRRAVYGVALFLSGRWLSDSGHGIWQATAVAGAAAVIVVAQPAGPAAGGSHAATVHSAPVSAAGTVVPPIPSPTAAPALPVDAPQTNLPSVPAALPIGVPPVQVPPVTLPVNVPALPSLPPRIRIP